MAVFYSGLQAQPAQAAQQMPQRGAYIPAGSYGQLSSQQIASPQSGAIERLNSTQPTTQGFSNAPSPVIQNIGAYNTMLGGSASGDVINRLGMQNYNKFESQYGQGSLPWYLRNQSSGGYGGDAYSQNLFLGNPGQVQAGYTYGQGASMMENMRDPLTGEIIGYGQSKSFAPINQDFWSSPNKTMGGQGGPVPLGRIMDKSYGGIDKAFMSNLDALNQPQMGQWDVWNAGDNWKQDAIMASRPTDPNSDAFANWWRSVNNLGYIPEDQKLAMFRQYRGM
jgi:hypothetical protein